MDYSIGVQNPTQAPESVNFMGCDVDPTVVDQGAAMYPGSKDAAPIPATVNFMGGEVDP